VQIDRLGPDDVERVLAAAHLFDQPPAADWTDRFLTTEGHHLLFAAVDDSDVGFVSGVEMTHPDKGTEMFLYELGVDESARGRGAGTALVAALRDLARERGCYGMWVLTDDDNAAAVAAYRRAGGAEPDPQVLIDWTFGDDGS
jgi:ribosomal protein S18 acetylase RimI-like enzyme